MSHEHRTTTKPPAVQGGLLIVGLVVLMIVGIVTAFLVVVEQPRQARNAAVELIRTKFGGEVETVSSCPEWLVGTFAEDYFTYVVAVRVAHTAPLSREDVRYLAPFRDLDVLEVSLPPGTTGVVEALPYSRDLVELHLANAAHLPNPADVPNLTDLVLANPAWTAGDAAVLGEYETLERVQLLRILDPAVAAAAIEAVSRLPNLVELRLDYSHVPDAALAHLLHAKSLLLLDLSATGITEEGVRHLADVTSLQHLALDNEINVTFIWTHAHEDFRHVRPNEVGDDAMRHIAKLTDLRFLQLDHTHVGDAGLEHVATLPILQYLYLEETPVGNAGVRHLQNLPHLVRLNLRKNWYARGLIDDEAVDDLVTLTDLEALILDNTDLSREGLARLNLELPRTKIVPLRPRRSPSALKQAKLDREAAENHPASGGR